MLFVFQIVSYYQGNILKSTNVINLSEKGRLAVIEQTVLSEEMDFTAAGLCNSSSSSSSWAFTD
jgi:hypothetical protein